MTTTNRSALAEEVKRLAEGYSYMLAGCGKRELHAAIDRLAAQPVQARVPLTDQELVILRHETRGEAHAPRKADLAYARAIERAHGITGEAE